MSDLDFDLSDLFDSVLRYGGENSFIPQEYFEDAGGYAQELSTSTGVTFTSIQNPIETIPLSTIRLATVEQVSLEADIAFGGEWDGSVLSNLFSTDYENQSQTDLNEQREERRTAETDDITVPTTSTNPDSIELGMELDRVGSENDPAGITQEHGMGVESGDMDVGEGIEMFDDEQEFDENAELMLQETTGAIKMPTMGDIEKQDAPGDIGTDTAVMSALSESIQAHQGSNSAPGQQMSRTQAEITQQKVEQLYDVMKKNLAKQEAIRGQTYNRLRNIEAELMSIDNLVYVKRTMITETELKHKITNRMHRVMAVQKQLVSIAFKMKDNQNFYYHTAVALDNICDNMLVLLNYLHDNPTKTIVLDHIRAFVSSALTYLSHTMGTIKESTKSNDEAHLHQYAVLIDNWAKRKENEENISRILKLDPNVGIDDSKFDKIMREKQNKIVTETLLLLRQSSEALQAFNTQSQAKVQTAVDNRKLRFASKKATDTAAKNTNNILQEYSRAPRGMTHPSRRLNALETPLATKKQSIYVSGYENSKAFFNL